MAAPTQGERAVATTWCTLDSEGKTTGVPKAKCKTSMDTAGELDESTKRSSPRGVSLEAFRLQRNLPRGNSRLGLVGEHQELHLVGL